MNSEKTESGTPFFEAENRQLHAENMKLSDQLYAAKSDLELSPGKDKFEAFLAGYSLGQSEVEMELCMYGRRIFFPTKVEGDKELLRRSYADWLNYSHKNQKP